MSFLGKKAKHLVSLLILSLLLSANPAQAATDNQVKFLKAVKAAKISALKKNTDKQLLEIGATYCGKVYYAGSVAAIYKKNRYIETPVTARVISKAALSNICGKKMMIVDSDGKVSWVTVYDEPSTVTFLEEVKLDNGGNDIGQKLGNAAKASPQPNPSSVVDPLTGFVKFSNCEAVKNAGLAPIDVVLNTELYALNRGLDRDKDGVACEE